MRLKPSYYKNYLLEKIRLLEINREKYMYMKDGFYFYNFKDFINFSNFEDEENFEI
ncbi:MAG: hypothetical protein ACFFBP_11365 [Promethearchaeota archaeon]